MKAPRIGLTGTTRMFDGAARSGVNAAYVEAARTAGGIPVILPPTNAPDHAPALIEGLEALVLTGGEDLDPALFGAAPHPKLGKVDRTRDDFELAAFHAAQARGLPVLAICRGIQLVNVGLGGTLWQDLPSERPGPVTHDHRGARDDRTHPVRLTPGSRAAAALGTETVDVNSFHHQAVRDLAPGLVAVGWAPDGVIEAAESLPGRPWLLAVQWHPEEFHREPAAADLGLFRALVEESLGARVAVSSEG